MAGILTTANELTAAVSTSGRMSTKPAADPLAERTWCTVRVS